MTAEQYDLCVVGAGIHGAGVAQAAAARGYSVLVLEQDAIAAGSSSRSSKLVHGGLRYLESAQFGLVRESLRERSILLRIAPELVRLRPFTIPVYRNSRRSPGQIRLGLSCYALLGGLRKDTRFRTIPRRDWQALDGLYRGGLQAVFRYQDAQTDDALLTLSVLRSAQQLGAKLVLPARFAGATAEETGCRVRYAYDGSLRACKVRVLVNAAGPWVGRVASSLLPRHDLPPFELVQGTHLVVGGEVAKGIYYLEVPQDGRAVFVMPWSGNTLVGTTETPFCGDPGSVRPLPQEEKYLLAVLRRYFPLRDAHAGYPVIDSFAGLRVLPEGDTDAFHRRRETTLAVDDPGRPRVLSILGGKLTTYRATAEKVMDRVQPALPRRRRREHTRTLRLPFSRV